MTAKVCGYRSQSSACVLAILLWLLCLLLQTDCFVVKKISRWQATAPTSTAQKRNTIQPAATNKPHASSRLGLHWSYTSSDVDLSPIILTLGLGEVNFDPATTNSHSILLSDSSSVAEGNINFPLLAVGVIMLGAAAVFAYANVVYTPEIIKEASMMRRENRELEVRKLIEAIRNHVEVNDNGDNDLEELRRPLEAALGVDSLDQYVESVESYFASTSAASTAAVGDELDFCEEDQDLANLIKVELSTTKRI